MKLDYEQIGKRIAKRRIKLGYRQAEVEEMAGIGYKYLSNIERGVSIPSLEVIMRISYALNTTPNEFLVGTANWEENTDKEAVQLICGLEGRKLELAKSFLTWLQEQDI